MQIVIDIPEEMYQKIKETSMVISGRRNGRTIDYTLFNAVNKGIPLPKGHGELIDRKDLIENGIHKGFCDWYDEIKMADTIIEADNEEES